MSEQLTIRHDAAFHFGDADDGVIGLPVLTRDGHVVEASYFFGQTRPKNIIVVSTQAGCPYSCSFCELGAERFGRHLTPQEMHDQVSVILWQARLLGHDPVRQPHKVTLANSGEPLLNPYLIEGVTAISTWPVSFKVSTVLPAVPQARRMWGELAKFAARYPRPVQPQISLISTDEAERNRLAGAKVEGFKQIRDAGEAWRHHNPRGRKVNLSLIITQETAASALAAIQHFPPDLFRFRFREYVPTRAGASVHLQPVSARRLVRIKREFADQGYEVGDWASPSPVERRFRLASNTFRRMYLKLIGE